MKLPIGKIIHGDCRKIIPKFPTGQIKLILTDPPYGIDYSKIQGTRPHEEKRKEMKGDKIQMNLGFLFERPELKIIFGAQHFMKQIPFLGRWLCWIKQPSEKSSFELAWIGINSGYYKLYQVTHHGAVNADNPNRPRYHPTQKPIKLMAAIIRDFSKPDDIILDPFVGSGSTCIAAEQTGRRWIGIEIDKEYCEITRKRIAYVKRNPGFRIFE